jgi:hypothetical protein
MFLATFDPYSTTKRPSGWLPLRNQRVYAKEAKAEQNGASNPNNPQGTRGIERADREIEVEYFILFLVMLC